MTQFGFARGAAAVGLLALAVVAGPAGAQDASLGRSVWLTQANCADCHGWFGDGDAEDPRSPRGANLRETGLDAEGLTEVILCGIPGTAMPHFDAKAYTDDRCYGMTKADIGDDIPPVSAMPLTKRHAQGLAQFILEDFVGKGAITTEECRALLGEESSRCAQYGADAGDAVPAASEHASAAH